VNVRKIATRFRRVAHADTSGGEQICANGKTDSGDRAALLDEASSVDIADRASTACMASISSTMSDRAWHRR